MTNMSKDFFIGGNNMRKYLALIVSFVLLFNFTLNVSAIDFIYSTEGRLEIPPVNSYRGRDIAPALIQNLSFQDVTSKHWALEPIMRLGALNIIKGYNYGGKHLYDPNRAVTNQEGLAFILRGLGLEQRAQDEANRLAAGGAVSDEILDLWSRGYLVVANQLGLITGAQLGDALSVDQELLDPEVNFIRSGNATREQLVEWVVKGIQQVDPTALVATNGQQLVYEFSDWNQINPDRIDEVESALGNNIIKGYSDGTFKPKGDINRAAMAQILKNIDNIYYRTQRIEKGTGVVVNVKESQIGEGLQRSVLTSIGVLNQKGNIIEFIHSELMNNNGQSKVDDAVVLHKDMVAGLKSLKDNDQIEYLVDRDKNTILYVEAKGKIVQTTLKGRLQALSDLSQGNLTIKLENGTLRTSKMADLIYTADSLMIDNKKVMMNQAPVDQVVELTMVEDVITNISLVGGKQLATEVTGVIIENNPLLGYITIMNNQGEKITKHYFRKTVKVEKQQYYDSFDEVGYYDEVFPNYNFDPRDSDPSMLEQGDTVSLILDDSNQDNVLSIYAKANLGMYYGKVNFVSAKGVEGSKIHLQLENGERIVMDVPKNTVVFKGGRTVSDTTLQVGDWVKVLVNEVVIRPGYELIKVKELVIDDINYKISNLYRGQISSFNNVQDTLSLKNAQTLSKMGWVNYQNQVSLGLGDHVEYFFDGNQVGWDYVEKYLKHKGQVYVAVEEYYGSEVTKKLTFREGTDYVVKPSQVVYSNGAGFFRIDGDKKTLKTDDGTIVVRNGRLVSEQNIMIPDYAQVVAKGSQAAIVNIMQSPITDNIKIYRGRIKSIVQGANIKVQSHAELRDMKWLYSPVQSGYSMNYETIIIDNNGIVPLDKFIDYTDNSRVDDVYTIFALANTAQYVVKQPYVKEGVRGEIYDISSAGNISLRDTYFYNQKTDSWRDFSAKNKGSVINTVASTVIIKNGEIVPISQLEMGDKIRVMSDKNLDAVNKSGSNAVDGYIIYVEG